MAQMCPVSSENIEIHAWIPSKGNMVKYIAKTVTSDIPEAFIIILGRDTTGVFTIEGGYEDDARGYTYANLAHTTFNGKRSIYKIHDGDDEEKFREINNSNDSLIAQQIKQKVLMQLRKYINKHIFNPDSLQRTGYVVNRKKDNSLWSLGITTNNNRETLAWRLHPTSTMCWCSFRWVCTVYKK